MGLIHSVMRIVIQQTCQHRLPKRSGYWKSTWLNTVRLFWLLVIIDSDQSSTVPSKMWCSDTLYILEWCQHTHSVEKQTQVRRRAVVTQGVACMWTDLMSYHTFLRSWFWQVCSIRPHKTRHIMYFVYGLVTWFKSDEWKTLLYTVNVF